jgi:excisionase family DNA binding protein
MDRNQNLLNVEEAAARLRVSVSTMHKYTSGRDISFYKLGGRLFFHESDVESFIQSRRKVAIVVDE